MPWNIPVFDSDGKIKDIRIFMPPILSASGNPLIGQTAAMGIGSTKITDQELRDLGFLLLNDYDTDPTGNDDSIVGINDAMIDAYDSGYTVWGHADAVYKVSDTVRCFRWTRSQQIQVMGGGGPGAAGARPIIRLEPNATDFDDPNDIRPVVCWRLWDNDTVEEYNLPPGHPLFSGTSGADDFKGKANNAFFDYWENFDIDNGGPTNPGAFGMYMPAAQRSFAAAVKITATGTAGGWWGILGRDSPIMDLEIIGGVFQLRNKANSGEGSAGSTVAGLRLVGDADTLVPIETTDSVPLTIVGFDIFQVNSLPIWTTGGGNSTGRRLLCMVDGKIETGSGVVFDNNDGKTHFMHNVYIKGTDDIIQSGDESIVTATGTWKRVNNYAYSDQTPTGAPESEQYATRAIVDSAINNDPEPLVDIDSGVAAPTRDFVAQHTITIPHCDSGSFINVESEGAVGVDRSGSSMFEDNIDNTTQDSRSHIQAAIDNAETAGHNTVFVPQKTYYVGAPGLFLKPDTIFIGGSYKRALIAPHGSWQPTSRVYVITSADDINGTAHMSNVGVFTRTKDGSGGGLSEPFEFDHFSWQLWRTGRNSSSIQPMKEDQFQPSEDWSQPKTYYVFEGNAGGKHYGFSHSQGRNFGNPDCKSLTITNTSEPMHIYGCNVEISSSGAPDAEEGIVITNSANIRIYGLKREGHVPTALVTDSDNIAFYGFGRQVEVDFAYNVRFEGATTNCLVGILVPDQKQFLDPSHFPTTPLSQGSPEQDVDGESQVKIEFPEGISVYKLGTLDDEAMVI